MSLDAALEVQSGDAKVTLPPYQTVLVPAAAQWCAVAAASGDEAPFMFVTPPESVQQLAARLLAAGVGQAQIDAFMEQF
jgi:hypothetical protein